MYYDNNEQQNGIVFDNKHSWRNFKALLNSRQTPPPTPIKTTVSVPFSQVVHDFSLINGSQVYNQRQLVYNFTIYGKNSTPLDELMHRVQVFENWLYAGKGKLPLYDDRIPYYHFVAECTNITHAKTDSLPIFAITATFTADPYMQPSDPGSDLKPIL
jgi:hypothetical protein